MFFGKMKIIKEDIRFFLDKIQSINLVCKNAIDEYMSSDFLRFRHSMDKAVILESEVDNLRLKIEQNIYSDMLVPESRGDILGILETIDDVADKIEEILVSLDIERPVFNTTVSEGFRKICLLSCESIDELIHAITLFFTDSHLTNNYISKVLYYEHEIDGLEEELKRAVFNDVSMESLGHKIQLRYFIEKMSSLSDVAEKVCQRLSLSIIKRSI